MFLNKIFGDSKEKKNYGKLDLSNCKIIKKLNNKGTVNLVSSGQTYYVVRVINEENVEFYKQLLNTHINNIGNVLAIVPSNRKSMENDLSEELQK